MAVLVAHASKHGSTEEIAAFVADRLRARGLDVALADTTEATIDGADAVVLLSGVYAGRWLGPATRFIRDHRDDLRSMPVWLVSSGPVGDDPPPIEELVVRPQPYLAPDFPPRIDLHRRYGCPQLQAR